MITAGAPRLALIFLTALTACAGGRQAQLPDWAVSGTDRNYPANRYVTGVGAAPLGDDAGRARRLAESRARQSLANLVESQIRATSRSQTQERVRDDNGDVDRQILNNVREAIRVRSSVKLVDVEVLDEARDPASDQLYVLVGIDLEAMAEKAREALAPLEDLTMRLAAAQAAQNPAEGIEQTLRAMEKWPSTPRRLRVLTMISPAHARRVRAGLPTRADARATLRNLLDRVEIDLTPQQPLKRGEPAALLIEHNAPGLDVDWQAVPDVLDAVPEQLGEHHLGLQAALPDRHGHLTVTATFPASGFLPDGHVSLARQTLKIEGTPAAAATIVAIEDDCVLAAPQVQQILSRCLAERGFRSEPLDTFEPGLARAIRRGGLNSMTLQGRMQQLALRVDRILSLKLTCGTNTEDHGGGFTLVSLNGDGQLVDAWLAGPPYQQSTSFGFAGAGPDPDYAQRSALESLERPLCERHAE